MIQKQKIYLTIDEVNALIPQMEECYQNFWSFRLRAEEIATTLDPQALKSLVSEDLISAQLKKSQAHFLMERARLELATILQIGGVIKDIESGLTDFFALDKHSGQELFLCWKYGEKKVRFWHGLEEGYAARKPISRRVYPRQ